MRKDISRTSPSAQPKSCPSKSCPSKSSQSKPVHLGQLSDALGEQIEELFSQGLEALRCALEANKQVVTRGGDIVDLGPDHATRLAAMNLLVTLCSRGRKPYDPPQKDRKGLSIADMAETLAAAEPALIARFEREARERREGAAKTKSSDFAETKPISFVTPEARKS